LVSMTYSKTWLMPLTAGKNARWDGNVTAASSWVKTWN